MGIMAMEKYLTISKKNRKTFALSVFFLRRNKKSSTYDAGYTYVAGQPYQDEIQQLLIKIVQKRFPKKSLVVLGIRTLFKNEFAFGESHQALLISAGEKIGSKKIMFFCVIYILVYVYYRKKSRSVFTYLY
jgi:hypothetical protein